MTIDYRPKRLSYSTATTFRQCKRRWAMQKIFRRELLTTSYPTTLGKFVHECLEAFYSLPPAKRDLDHLNRIARLVHDGEAGLDRQNDDPLIVAMFDATVGPVKPFTLTTDYVLMYLTDEQKKLFKHEAWNYLIAVWEHENPEEVNVIHTEMNFKETLLDTMGREVPVNGQIDRVDEIDGEYVAYDYKTGKMSARKYLSKKRPQLVLYSAIIKKVYGKLPKLARFMFLGSGDYDFIPTDKMVESEIDKFSQTWQDMHTAIEDEEFPPTPQYLCGWCPYIDECEEGQQEVRKLLNMGLMKPYAPAVEMLELHHLVR